MFHIVLVQPEIPPNTGNIIRLAANTGCTLHLVAPLGFQMDDKLLRRAGLDYHEWAQVQHHSDWAALRRAQQALHAAGGPEGGTADGTAKGPATTPPGYALTTRGTRCHTEVAWRPGDWLVFGRESSGLPPEVRDVFAPAQRVRLPMLPGQRSLNLSNAVAVVVFEAWRQQGFAGAAPAPGANPG